MVTSDHMLTLLKEVGALKEGHFKLASGRHSGHYVQVAQLSQYPARLMPLLREARPALEALGPVDTVFFPAIGALPVGQLVGCALEKRAVFAERNARNEMELRRGFEIREGENLLLVEDVITTGGTLFEIKKMAEAKNARIRGVFCIINRSGSDTWDGLPLVSLLNIQFPTYAPDDVPEALAAIPVCRPGTKSV